MALPQSYRGPGFRVRLSSVKGATAKGLLTEPLYLPCILGDFDVEEEFDHADYDTVAAGEFSVPAAGPVTARRLRTTDLSTLTIDWHAYARFLVNPQLSPDEARRQLYAIGRSRSPFELLVAAQLGIQEELRMKATMRSLSRTAKPGEADTRYYSMAIKEWRDNSLRRRAAGSGRSTLPTTAKLTNKTTLNSLARHFYPDSPLKDGWRAIARANGITNWGPSTPLAKSKRWKVGDKIKIPKKPK